MGKTLKTDTSPDWIPGIFNYCDRWCERCEFTGRCRSFALEMDELRAGQAHGHDMRSKEFWSDINAMMQETLEFIRRVSAEHGIRLEDITTEEILSDKSKEHVILEDARTYSKMAQSWLEVQREFIESKLNETKERIRLQTDAKRAATEADLVKDAIEIIRWYEPQIWVKLVRALSGKQEDSSNGEEIQTDYNGSAKVALVAIDQSLAAWGQLQHIFPEQTDNFITILLHLDRLRRKIEQELPHARDFRRPGFDL